MKKLDIKEVNKKRKPSPLFKGMPKSLKDPSNYEAIEKQLIEIIQIDHRHKTASSYAKCDICQAKREERKLKMKQIGFKSIQQYLEWKKIHEIIKNKQDFRLW